MYKIIALVLVGVVMVFGKDCEQKFHGCKIDYSRRECLEGEAVGCKNPFPYDNMEECTQDFSGHGNICDQKKWCKNEGLCLPVLRNDSEQKRVRGYKCDCHGTGFYGKHCEHKCTPDLPKDNILAEACVF